MSENGGKALLVLSAALLLVFLIGLVELFRLKFETGDTFPPYSTLRTDPLGAKALYQSLQKLGDPTVRRNYEPLDQLPLDTHMAVVFLGYDNPALWSPPPESSADPPLRVPGSFDPGRTAVMGARTLIVLSLQDCCPDQDPEAGGEAKFEVEASSGGQKRDQGTEKKQDGVDRTETPFGSGFLEKWDLKLDSADDQGGVAKAFLQTNRFDLPAVVPWPSIIRFSDLDDAWTVVYADGRNRPVIVARRYGAGELILSADSYLFSNEALVNHPHPRLLAWFFGQRSDIVFDESHHGLTETPGVSTLIRKYRLFGLIAGLVVLAGLFIWQNAFSLTPPPDHNQTDPARIDSGRDAAGALNHLLKKNLTTDRLIDQCLTEFENAGQDARWRARAAAAARQSLAESRARGRVSPAEAYRLIQQTIQQEKTNLWKPTS